MFILRYQWFLSASVLVEKKNMFCVIVIVCYREPLCSYGNKTGTSVLAVSVQHESGRQDPCAHQNSTEGIQYVNRWRILAWSGEEKSMNCSLWISYVPLIHGIQEHLAETELGLKMIF